MTSVSVFRSLNGWIAIGLVLGLITGLTATAGGPAFFQKLADAAAPFGQLFINAIRMVVIPLVVALIIGSVVKAGQQGGLLRVGRTALFGYIGLLVPAIALGMGVMAVVVSRLPTPDTPSLGSPEVPTLPSVVEFLVSLVPPNPFAAAADGALLPLIVFTLLFALAASRLPTAQAARISQAAHDVADALIQLVRWVLWLAPIGVFGLIAPATAALGWELVAQLGVFALGVIAALALYVVGVYLPLMAAAQLKPTRFLSGTVRAAALAFATTSTAAAIPVSLKDATDNLNVPREAAELLVPFGASIFRPGSALFQAAAIVFLAYLFGVEMGAAGYMTAFLATFVVSLTVAPVPSASVMTLAPALGTLGIPGAGLGLLLAIDRIPDMFRSAVNVWGQIAVAVLAGRTQRSGISAGEPTTAKNATQKEPAA